ncbi:acetyl-coenzyme a carboxylase carboxyl transferase subunit beta chloroplastic [Phtheirospermum japonicum]|uniref:Acetyl-coenzyme a carboxylase carboxyl transferase subunit beta chloroplastic n=1 Tax=Phtheirospermum japonicum TaxID=374723 RepID=A0A830BW99_9LAMI|nr:acetyl-coenzyme a carboxylase carboxyl transferase subunit beta chloroplastic [Phtheirospermum japonicum]
MLGDIIISEPNSYIAFVGKRVIEQTLNKTVPEGSQAAEYLFQKGFFDLIVPRKLLNFFYYPGLRYISQSRNLYWCRCFSRTISRSRFTP